MKLTIVLSLLLALVIISVAQPGRRGPPFGFGPPRRRGPPRGVPGQRGPGQGGAGQRGAGQGGTGQGIFGKGGKGKEGRGKGRGKGPNPEDLNCFKARMACRITQNGVMVLNRQCDNGVCTPGGTNDDTVTMNGQTYVFTRCSLRPNRPDRCLANPVVLPPASDSAVEQVFCDEPIWYKMACRVVETATNTVLKPQGPRPVDCPRNGQCASVGYGSYTHQNAQGQYVPVTVSFCQNCEERQCELPTLAQTSTWTAAQFQQWFINWLTNCARRRRP